MKVNDKIDNVLKKEKYRKYGIIFFSVILISFLYIPFSPISSSNIEGVTTRLTANLTDDGNIPIWLIKVDDNKIVKASLQTKMVFQKGKRVEIRMTKTLIGSYSYRVLRYLQLLI